MPLTNKPSRSQILSVVAATVTALACGTNYVYSAWGPQFAQRLKLSSTESNLIGTFGNLGMYTTGIPFGMIVDAKGPRWGVGMGTVLFGVGYYALSRAFDAGPGVFSVAVLCAFSYLTGTGSSAAFCAAIKAAALSLPDAQGTATAFPLAAFGLSAFFFATVSLALPHDTSHFLILLAVGTVILPIISFPFLGSFEPPTYEHVPQDETGFNPRTGSMTGEQRRRLEAIDLQDLDSRRASPFSPNRLGTHRRDSDELSLSSDDSFANGGAEVSKSIRDGKGAELAGVDVRGFSLLHHIEFYQFFCMLGLLAGIGLMTINNIGNDLHALWRFYDPNATGAFIAKRQAAHVSTLSVCSFTGRLLSGIGSDILVNKFNYSRLWCVMVSATLFAVTQIIATFIETPDYLILVAGSTGIAYGMLFGVYPSLVSSAFGIHGLSQNWGTMTLAPAIMGNVFNILYGRIFDANSVLNEEGHLSCSQGRACYSKAYLATWTASLVALLVTAWSIYHEKRRSATTSYERIV